MRGILVVFVATLFSPFAVFAGSQTYTTPGTYSFSVPAYGSLTVQVWGAGGGGGGSYNSNGGTGGYSSFGSVVGYGGSAGTAGVLYVSQGYGGAGGGASGGSTNLSGSSGGNGDGIYSGSGGNSPYGGSGGRGGSWWWEYTNGDGSPGGVPGGGGGGGGTGTSCCPTGGGGGGSGYAAYTYSSGQLTPGAGVTIVVGNGGAGGYAGSAGSGASGAPGQVSITWTDPPPPTCSVWADTNPIAYGATTNLRWTSSNATSFYINSVGYVTPNQTSNASIGPLSTTNYSGTATGNSGSVSCPFTLNVNPPANCTFNGQTVNHGNSVTAYQSPSVPYNQTCNSQQRTCNNGNLSGNYNHASCTVNNPPPTCALSLNPTSVTQGTPSTLTWSSTNATSCTGNNFTTGGAISGNVSVTPLQSTTYTASCTRPGSSIAQCTGTGSGGTGALLTVSCTPTYTCTGAGNQTITHKNSTCQTSTITTCVSPQFCSEGASVCINSISSGNISATPNIVNTGGTSRITWSSSDVVSCLVYGNGNSWTALSGTQISNPITGKVVYTLACDDHDADTVKDDLIKTETVVTVGKWKER